MNAVKTIESAVQALPEDQVLEFGRWFDQYRSRLWDEQLEADAAAGRLDCLLQDAEREIAAGKSIPLDEFLCNP